MVPFREGTANVRMSPKAHSPSPTWLVSFDIPMPLNMQDEYFTVVINGETGLVINILTPTGMLE